MRVSKLVSERLKDIPNGVVAKSHSLLLRAGYIKQVSNGIYTLMPAGQRVSLKIINIIREEMNKIGGQEVLMPVVMPKELWEKSGRFNSIGQEMVRFKDRNNHDMLLGMTHEEAAVHLCQNTIKSYDQLPYMIYQIQTKFRDEARPRAGLLRVKEFTMKDAYSFHTSQKDLENYYKKVYKSYQTIFKRMGMKNCIAVSSDSGMMGGQKADEFQLLVEAGEDNIIICSHCDYKANMEIATSIIDKVTFNDGKLQEAYTEDAKSIDEVSNYLKIDQKQIIKAVCYAIEGDPNSVVVAFIRGDKEINEAKLKKIVGGDVVVKDISEDGLVKGNIGPIGLTIDNAILVFDKSISGQKGLVCGANKEKYHLINVNMERDVKVKTYYDIAKVSEGEKCPICGHPLNIKKGIEVGNIFQLGTKYTKSMGMTIQDRNGEQINPIMGCYGIGVGRSLAGIVEELSDEKGIVWPIAIAPWQIYLSPLRMDDDNVKLKAEELYKSLSKKFEVIYDDRNVSAGIKLTDSELMGIPIRVLISPRSLANQEAEITIRKTGEKIMVNLKELKSFLAKTCKELRRNYE